MPAIRVVTDSACDLPDALLAELGVGVVPLRIRFGAEEFVDRRELTTKEFWTRSAATRELPETSAPSPGAFSEAFKAIGAEGADAVVCITLSSRLSATHQAASQAARDLDVDLKVRVVDSLSVTLGQGLVVQVTAQAAAGGGSLDEVVARAEGAAAAVRVFGAIDTLDNLKRGGRIGNARALLGSLLAIKPVIEVREGVVEEESKQRTRGRSLRYLADKVVHAGALDRLAVMSAAAGDLDTFLAMLDGVTPAEPMLVGDIGPVIGTHIGRGAIGVAWLPAG